MVSTSGQATITTVGSGFDTLLVTVDVPVAGARLRDVRNGMTIPPTLTPRTVLNAIPRPAWWINFLTTEPLAFASLDAWSGTVADLLDTMFDPTVTYEDLAWIRDQWPGKVSVKGVQSVDDDDGFINDYVVDQNSISLDRSYNSARVGQTAGFQHDSFQAGRVRGNPAALVAKVTQGADQVGFACAAAAASGQQGNARSSAQKRIIHRRLSRLVYHDMHGAKAANM